MNTPCKRSAAAFAICVALAGASLPARAESGVRIRFRDLDLSSSEGIAALYQRIERGARLVCRDSSAPWDAGSVRTFQRCHEAAIEDAVATINQPRLTALHLEKSGRPCRSAHVRSRSRPGQPERPARVRLSLARGWARDNPQPSGGEQLANALGGRGILSP